MNLAADEGEAGPPGTSCVRGKMAAPGSCSQELKMEDAAARRSGAGESPTQRKEGLGLAPRWPLLPVTPWCTGRSSVTPEPPFGAPLVSTGGGDLMALEFAHVWWVETAAKPAWQWKKSLEFAPLRLERNSNSQAAWRIKGIYHTPHFF